ncbi:type II toxin-antitoxin system RelE/ParE family toxin [Solimicrobium silvestre]|uniref:Addiction module toxin RelE n=1 Tax=Solimicrobium silvestre TaxID=2099400 RepID=A0A2S9H304_9BURK|nr:type II toxin-antitoxin system RelE/ParE family toxin [Solimicrobium silvestre]PRC94365.1 hypothetical protein S2091_0986 [Solimicrobium silvestre]
MLTILAVPSFTRISKKLHKTEKLDLEVAMKAVAADPTVGEEKKGDLSGMFVYKYYSNKQQVLLSYHLQPSKFNPESVTFLSIGSHENFYVNLKLIK